MMAMSKTTLAAVSAYLQPARKKRLDKIAEATSRRMTVSKLIDELAEMGLPDLERKYLGISSPGHDGHTRHKTA